MQVSLDSINVALICHNVHSRHTCICASCFNKLERCPMCRGPIKSYFCIRGEEYLESKENNASSKNDERPPARRRWFNGINWDDRLIDFLGFSR